MNAPHFKYYLEGLDKPEPMFGLWMPNANGFSDVCGETVLAAGKPLPLFPDYKTWSREVAFKRRCGRCWRVTRGLADLARHNQISHLSAPAHFPVGAKLIVEHHKAIVRRDLGIAVIVLLGAFLFTGCNAVRKLTGLDRHDAKHVDVPVATSIIRQLPADSGITFSPDRIDPSPAHVRVFVKTGFWLTASPGAWHEIPWAVDVDTRTTEYAVINFTAQVARVYNQPAESPRAIIVESVPVGAFDPGIPPQ